MKSSIYISAEQIQVIGYSGKNVAKVVTFPLPEGTMFNGNIMDSAFLSECLVSMKGDNPGLFKSGVSLVVDGSSILTRRLTIPKLNHKQNLQRVRDDFVDSISDTNDLVCAYRKMSDGTIMGCGVNKTQVDSYVDTFKAAGIKLATIHVGAELLHILVGTTTALQQDTIVLNVMDGQMILSAIFVGGNNIMMQRTRLFGDEKEEIHRQIIDNLSNLNQFAQSQKHEEIKNSYYLGMSVPDILLLEEMNTHEGISIHPLGLYKGSVDIPPQAHFATLNMLYGSKGIDLMEARRELTRYVKSKKPKKLWIPALALYALVLIGLASFLWFQLQDVQNRVGVIENFLNSPATLETQETLNNLVTETRAIERIGLQFNARLDWENTMPAAYSRLLNQIIFEHGVDVSINAFEFNEATGIARISGETTNPRAQNDYVDVLYRMGVASDVRYFGFSSNQGVFTFSADIFLMIGGDE